MKLSNYKILSTFAEYMICPNALQHNGVDIKNLKIQGKHDFDDYKFKHQSINYTGESNSSTTILLEKLKLSLKESLKECDKEPLLLLSDGKDSMGLALALSEAGLKCKTLTFLRRNDDLLKEYIITVAEQLGHFPFFVTVDEIQSSFDQSLFLNACKTMETPVLDQGFLFFLYGCNKFFLDNNLIPKNFVLIDGLGNDEHFGYLPSIDQQNSFRLSLFGLWRLVPKKFFPSMRWYLRSPAESHGDLSALSAFFSFGNSIDLNEYFSGIRKSINELPFVDFRAFSRGSFHDHQCMMGKTIATAKVLEASVIFPWVEKQLADYCFNLPISSKFDFKSLKNKLLLRNLLSEKIGWEQQKRGVDLFKDLDLMVFKDNFLNGIVPEKITQKIDKTKFLPVSIKQRAYLEVLNFYGYCKSHGLSEGEIESILNGR